MADENDRIMYCVQAKEGTFYTRDRAMIIPYLQKMFLTNALVYELRNGTIHTYLGTEKTYLNSLA